MPETSEWISEKEASGMLSVDKKNLELLRENGYLRPGTHWRSSPDSGQLPWKPKVFYCIPECKKVIDNWKGINASSAQIAA